MMRKDEYKSKVVVQWGRNCEYENVSDYVVNYLQIINEQIIIAAINEEVSNDDDIETVWLI